MLLAVQVKTEGGKIIRVEAHPIPEHPRPKRCQVAHGLYCQNVVLYHSQFDSSLTLFRSKLCHLVYESITCWSE